MKRAAGLVAGVAGAAMSAAGQESIRYEWSFTEVAAGTGLPVTAPNGLIEPGEAARISLRATVLPGIGAPATYVPPPAPGVGTIEGLGVLHFDLLAGPGAGAGQWSSLQQRAGWTGAPYPVFVGMAAGNDVLNAGSGQFVLPGSSANTTNPIADLWRGVWTPGDYAPRTVAFRSSAAAASSPDRNSAILIQYGVDYPDNPLYLLRYVPGEFGSVQIPIVPTPGAAATALYSLTALGLRRARRGGDR